MILQKITVHKFRMQFNHPTGYERLLGIDLLCACKKNGCHSIVIASDYLSHNKYAVLAFMSMLVDHLKHTREFNRYVVFSDGAPIQFKQKFTICGMTLIWIQL